MRRLAAAIAFFLVALTLPGVAQAQCAFDTAAKAKGGKFSLVRSYAACPSTTFLAPNTSTQTSTPACTPPFAHSTYDFNADRGQCTLKVKHKLESPCPDGSGVDCTNWMASVKCSGINDPGGGTPIEGSGWALAVTARVTWDDHSNGDMTLIDFPAQWAFPPASGGKLKVKIETASCGDFLFCPLFGPPLVPACSTFQILSAGIHDPTGKLFATLGTSSGP